MGNPCNGKVSITRKMKFKFNYYYKKTKAIKFVNTSSKVVCRVTNGIHINIGYIHLTWLHHLESKSKNRK